MVAAEPQSPRRRNPVRAVAAVPRATRSHGDVPWTPGTATPAGASAAPPNRTAAPAVSPRWAWWPDLVPHRRSHLLGTATTQSTATSTPTRNSVAVVPKRATRRLRSDHPRGTGPNAPPHRNLVFPSAFQNHEDNIGTTDTDEWPTIVLNGQLSLLVTVRRVVVRGVGVARR
jgi:hypothetical protein